MLLALFSKETIVCDNCVFNAANLVITVCLGACKASMASASQPIPELGRWYGVTDGMSEARVHV